MIGWDMNQVMGRQSGSSEHSASFRTMSGLVRLPLAARRIEIAQLTTTIQDDIKGIINTYLGDFTANPKCPKVTNLNIFQSTTAIIPAHSSHRTNTILMKRPNRPRYRRDGAQRNYPPKYDTKVGLTRTTSI